VLLDRVARDQMTEFATVRIIPHSLRAPASQGRQLRAESIRSSSIDEQLAVQGVRVRDVASRVTVRTTTRVLGSVAFRCIDGNSVPTGLTALSGHLRTPVR
jgi:hypothetical protein